MNDRKREFENGTFVPLVGSTAYTEQEYWESRFKQEDSYEWLCGYKDFRELIHKLVSPGSSVLLVGTGNSPLPIDIVTDTYVSVSGVQTPYFSKVVATDYSEAVIKKMSLKTAQKYPGISWHVSDMTNMSSGSQESVTENGMTKFGNESFDVVLDKAAMDAVLADGADKWNPPKDLLDVAHKICEGVHQVLKPGGIYIQISFSQKHFRSKYLLQKVSGEDTTPASKDNSQSLISTSNMVEPVESSDDEWEEDLTPHIRTNFGSSTSPEEVAEGTLWSTFETYPIEVALGYTLYFMRK